MKLSHTPGPCLRAAVEHVLSVCEDGNISDIDFEMLRTSLQRSCNCITIPCSEVQHKPKVIGQWYVISAQYGHYYSGPYSSEAEAQIAIEKDPSQSGGIPSLEL